jgi:hypothetical protein
MFVSTLKISPCLWLNLNSISFRYKYNLIVILPTIFFSGFMLGLYVTFLYQNRLQVLDQNGTLIPIIGGIAGDASILKFIYDWNEQLTLKFDGIISRDAYS